MSVVGVSVKAWRILFVRVNIHDTFYIYLLLHLLSTLTAIPNFFIYLFLQ